MNKLISACNDKWKIDNDIVCKAVVSPFVNDFENVHNLLKRADLYELSNTVLMFKNDGMLNNLHCVLELIMHATRNYEFMNNNTKLKIDSSDIIGLTEFKYPFVTYNQSKVVLKKYGYDKCKRIAESMTYGMNSERLRVLFTDICRENQIYCAIHCGKFFHYKSKKQHGLHEQLLTKLKRLFAFKNGCKAVLPICECTQTLITDLPTVTDYFFGNDYLLYHVVKFL